MSNKKVAKRLWYGAAILFLFMVPLFARGQYTLHILIMAAMNIILASSLRLIATSGQLSLAHGGMMAVGAYTSALLMMKLGISSWASLPLAGLVAAGLALLVGFPFVRIKGIYFAMVTVFLAEMIMLAAEHWRGLTGGSSGLVNIPQPGPIVIQRLLTIDFDSKVHFYYFILVLMLLTLLFLYAIERSRIALTLLSIQQNESLAESAGINTSRFKVLAFCIGCFFAGIAGGFYCQYINVINPRSFGFFFSIYIVVYMIVGGVKKFSGPIYGAFILSILPELIRALKEFQPFIFAGVLMLVIFFLPEGLVDLRKRFVKFYKMRFNRA
ncbi:MAG: branched-chain amino acid ABC transporter permease [Deltaproteobacteria bacterium]|nr:branched-chain amino acid ABC transporter permease [Deltaproteobacteria bacterium]MBW2117066.1 branched-chain amino acid ABC transporter permease [Deltaproteobacteria bacterium]